MRKTILVLEPTLANDVPPPPPTPTNAALLAGIERGDAECFYQLFRRHADLIRGVIARFVTPEDECEEVLREVFETIRDRAEHYTEEKGQVLGWMITLARRCALTRARSIEVPAEVPAGRKLASSKMLKPRASSGRNESFRRFPDLTQAAA
jgi:DNA-directed RNA polymerase specialized sigma24 family protein